MKNNKKEFSLDEAKRLLSLGYLIRQKEVAGHYFQSLVGICHTTNPYTAWAVDVTTLPNEDVYYIVKVNN